MKLKIFAAALLLTLTGGTGHAEILSDYGSRTCAQWTLWHSGQPTTEAIAADNWIFGTLEGTASFAAADSRMRGQPPADVLRGLDGPTVIALMSEYCRPQRTLKDTVAEISAQLIAESGLVASIGRRHVSGPGRVLVVTTTAPRETTGAAVVQTTGSIAVVAKPGLCEALIVNGRTATGAPITRTLYKCN